MPKSFWREKRFWILTSCTLLPASFGLGWGLVPGRPAQIAAPHQCPRLQVDTQHRDLGVVYPGDRVQLQYHLDNAGRDELLISDLRSSCGCAPATIDATSIPSGGSATIEVHFQTPLAAGVVGHAVRFRTNDPDHGDVALTFQVLARRAIEAAPPNLFIGAVMQGTDVSHELELCSTDGKPFQVIKHSASASWIRLTPLDPASRRHTFHVTIDAQAPLGAFSESAEFITSCPRQERVIVPIRGEVVSPFGISPARLLLRSVPPGSIVDAKLLIASPRNVEYTIQAIRTQNKEWRVVSWELTRISDAKSGLHVRVRVPAEAGYKRASLLLHPSGADPVLQVPMSCMVVGRDNPKR